MNRKIESEIEVTENRINMKLKLKQNISMSVNIAAVNSAQKWNKMKYWNGKIEIENEVTENKIKTEIYVKTKYWHERCSCWHE